MPKFFAITKRFFRPRTRGSVLIMVVAVLVLLALMGTAYISIARIDRQASIPLNESSLTDVIDQLMPAVKTLAMNAVTKDVVPGATYGYRRPTDPDYENYDYAGANWINRTTPANNVLERNNDFFLASRLPDLYPVPAQTGGVNIGGTNNFWMWPSLTRSLNQPDQAADPTAVMGRFESPFDPGYSAAQKVGFWASWPQWSQDQPDARTALFFVPSDISIYYPTTYADSALKNRVRVFPALTPYIAASQNAADKQTLVNDPITGRPMKILAADADGDGIADSALVRLPNATIGDISFFYATRIIDNNSAVNVNTARSLTNDFQFNSNNPSTAAGLTPTWAFPGSVGLFEMFVPGGPAVATGASPAQRVEFDAIQGFMLQSGNTTMQTAEHQAVSDPFDPAGTKTSGTGDDNPLDRADYWYTSQNEAYYFELASRVNNPGFRTSGGSPPASGGADTRKLTSFLPDVNLDLHYRFGMLDTTSDTPSVSSLEGILHSANVADRTYGSAPNYTPPTPAYSLASRFKFFPAVDSQYWYHYSYNVDSIAARNTFFSGAAPALPLRSILVTNNPVSNRIMGHSMGGGNVPNASMLPYGCKGRWNKEETYNIGDIVYYAQDPTTAGLTMTEQRRTFLFVNIIAPPAPAPNAYPPPPIIGAAVNPNWRILNPRGVWDSTATYNAGDIVQHDTSVVPPNVSPSPAWGVYICRQNGTSGAGQTPGGGGNWVSPPGYVSPPKVSLNTAPFEELFRGFWNVMEEGNTGNVPGVFLSDMTALAGTLGAANVDANTTPATPNDPYIGNRFHNFRWLLGTTAGPQYPFDPIMPTEAEYASLPGVTNLHPLRMFRSPIRSIPFVTGPAYTQQTRRLTPQSVMQLRAALAAVNAIDMRDADNDVTSRRITLQMVQGPNSTNADIINVDAMVYGTEAQPFITEIFASTDTSPAGPGNAANYQGYVAIELYNPYPFDIPLTNWKLAALNRIPRSIGPSTPGTGSSPSQDMQLVNVGGPTNTGQMLVDFTAYGAAGITPVVPARGYLLLENYNDPADPLYAQYAAMDPTACAALYRPPSTGLPPTGAIPAADAGSAPSPSANRIAPVPQLNRAFLALPRADNASLPDAATMPPNSWFNQEIVFVKPRRFDGVYTNIAAGAAIPGLGSIAEDPTTSPGGSMQDLVPVDQFDFTGLIPSSFANWVNADNTPSANNPALVWHYQRASNEDSTPAFGGGGVTKNWHFVYPGRYDATESITTGWNTNTPGFLAPRQQGTCVRNWNPGAAETDPWDLNTTNPAPARPVPETTLGTTYNSTIAPPQSSNAANIATWRQTFPVPLAFGNFSNPAAGQFGSSIGYHPPLGLARAEFPFGGFSKNGDVLSVPFIGAYVIFDPNAAAPGTIIEMNSVSMDASMAEDTNTLDDPQYMSDIGAAPRLPTDAAGLPAVPVEQLGRFCPGWHANIPGVGGGAGLLLDYDWARDVLDQFTAIQNTHDDFLPNTDPARYLSSTGAGVPSDVANTKGAFANTDKDWDAGPQGLINVNTASWPILAQLPLVVDGTGTTDTALTEALAKSIVYYRDIDDGTGRPHGAFTTLFELNGVVDNRLGGMGTDAGFQNMMGDLNLSGVGTIAANNDPDDLQGDTTPWNPTLLAGPPPQPATDGVRLDYEERNLNLIRLSNLLTTRSDTFTCYILLQAWKNAGTATPQLMGERRQAFEFDRSMMSSGNSVLNTLTIPSR